MNVEGHVIHRLCSRCPRGRCSATAEGEPGSPFGLPKMQRWLGVFPSARHTMKKKLVCNPMIIKNDHIQFKQLQQGQNMDVELCFITV